MKKNAFRTLLMMLLVALIVVPTMQSCKSKKEVQAPDDEVLIQTYCSGPEYFTDNEFFRANSIGESTDR